MALTGEIKKVTPAGVVSTFVNLPSPAPGFMTGLAFDRTGRLYVGFASFDPATSGVWRVDQSGVRSLFAPLPANGLPNGLAFDRRGNLFVSDSGLGQIYKIDHRGIVSVWKADDLLLGLIPPGPPLGVTIGANGIAFDMQYGNLYVSNTDFGKVLRIPVASDGTAGDVAVFLDDPALLTGADGIAFDVRGNLYVAVNRQNRIVSISPTGATSILAEGGLLQFPASPAFGAGRESKHLYVTNFALLNALGAAPGDPMPALLNVIVGIPGKPLP